MALRKDITKEVYGTQIVIKDVEFKIMDLRGDKNRILMNVQGKISTQDEPIEVENYYFTPNLDGINFIAQGYEYLKSLPEYLDAVDC